MMNVVITFFIYFFECKNKSFVIIVWKNTDVTKLRYICKHLTKERLCKLLNNLQCAFHFTGIFKILKIKNFKSFITSKFLNIDWQDFM